jgi:hypothetical protein
MRRAVRPDPTTGPWSAGRGAMMIADMTEMKFTCPETGLPLGHAAIDDQLAAMPRFRMAMHCPKCSQLHAFAFVEEPVEEVA